MSLGGYKFAGYKCAKGSLSDTEFCLYMHKTRLKAFIEACAKTESNWHFCKNNGTVNYESTEGVIYDVNNNGYNYVSFFQYGEEDKYLAILTLPNQTSGYFNDNAKIYDYSTRTYPCNMYYFTCFHCASVESFNDYQFFLNGHTYPTSALQLLPVTNLYPNSDSYANLDTQWSFYADATRGYTIYFGYAVKGSKIISFSSTSDMSYLEYGFINATLIGFDAMKLSSQSDTYNIFGAVLRYDRTGEIGWSHVSLNNNGPNKHIITLTGSGTRFNGYNKASNCMVLNDSHIAITDGTGNDTPFSPQTIISGDNNCNYITSGLNSDGILSKGLVDIDYLASNIRPGNTMSDCEVIANGNYLLVSRGTTNKFTPQFYVGWDASNPDIKADSSWDEYVEPVILPSVEHFLGYTDPPPPYSKSIAMGNSLYLYDIEDHYLSYDSSKLYSISQWSSNGTTVSGWTDFGTENRSGYLAIINLTAATKYPCTVNVYTCNNRTVEVILVYDSQGTEIRAFKYTERGVDYYYVMDLVQDDWTDDLSSIGYSLFLEKTFYLQSGTKNYQTGVTNSSNVTQDPLYQLYDDEECTKASSYNVYKHYRAGSYSNGEWIYQKAFYELPVRTTSDLSKSVSSKIVVTDNYNNLLKLWFATNYLSSLTTSLTQIIIRAYDWEYITAYYSSSGSSGSAQWITNGTLYAVYDASGSPIPYDVRKVYTVLEVRYDDTHINSFISQSVENNNGYIRVKVSFSSSGSDGKNCKKVMIGWEERKGIIEAYLTNQGAAGTGDTYMSSNIEYTFYDASGNAIPYDSSKTYITIACYVKDGSPAYAMLDSQYWNWSTSVLMNRGTNNYYYKVLIQVS